MRPTPPDKMENTPPSNTIIQQVFTHNKCIVVQDIHPNIVYVSGIDRTHIECYADLVARASPKNNELERKATNMCNQSELISKVEALKDFIKAEMQARGVEEMEVATHICRFTTILSNRFDTTVFKRVHGDLYKAFTKQTTARRFSVT